MAILELYLKMKLFYMFIGLGFVVLAILFIAFIYVSNSIQERREKKLWREKQKLKKYLRIDSKTLKIIIGQITCPRVQSVLEFIW